MSLKLGEEMTKVPEEVGRLGLELGELGEGFKGALAYRLPVHLIPYVSIFYSSCALHPICL